MLKVGEGFSFAEVFDLARRLEQFGNTDDDKYSKAASALRELLPANYYPGMTVGEAAAIMEEADHG